MDIYFSNPRKSCHQMCTKICSTSYPFLQAMRHLLWLIMRKWTLKVHWTTQILRLMAGTASKVSSWRNSFSMLFKTLRPRQTGRHFADDTFNHIFMNENVRISIKFSLKFVPKVPINNIPALIQIMAWCRSGAKPLSEPIILSLLMHICITRPQWIKQDQM